MEDGYTSPQLENGYTKIANEILDRLIPYRISGREWQVLLTIIRKTYGFNKKEDFISMSQFANLTGMDRPSVARQIKKLLSKKLIGVSQKGNTPANSYIFQKDWTKWGVLSKRATVLAKKATEVLSKKAHTKESIKEINTYSSKFSEIWDLYPVKAGRKMAERHFLASVKNEQDWKDINIALINYKAHLKKETWKKPQNGSTWFNNWQDWINFKEETQKQEAIWPTEVVL